jgi:multiple sugar transport system substrate-binding protein
MGAVAAGAFGAACGSGSDKPSGTAAKAKDSTRERTLRIAQWSHFIPAYDAWFDNEYTQRWGEDHGVEVVVDHVALDELSGRADAEVAAGRGHDLFGFIFPPAGFEDEVIDHREVVEEVATKLGPMASLAERSVLSRRTGKYFAFPDYWVPNPVHYRVDLWDRVERGLTPDTWGDVLRAGPALKTMGHPLGVGVTPDFDSDFWLLSLMHAYGASVQDEAGSVIINSPATIEAVGIGAAIFRGAIAEEVFSGDPASGNRLLASGKAPFILNAISAIRAIEAQDPELATHIALAPLPAGPVRRLGVYTVLDAYVIWRFSTSQDLAKQFLVDLALSGREGFLRSGYYNLPAFPGSVANLPSLVATDGKAKPPDKYSLLADAASWSTNFGHPGHANAAFEEVFNQHLVPKMFAAAARGEMTAEDSVRAAEAEIKLIYDKWRERGKV